MCECVCCNTWGDVGTLSLGEVFECVSAGRPNLLLKKRQNERISGEQRDKGKSTLAASVQLSLHWDLLRKQLLAIPENPYLKLFI